MAVAIFWQPTKNSLQLFAIPDISFEILGEEVDPESIERSVGAVGCQEHGEQSTITVRGPNLDSLAYEITGCCQTLAESAKRNLR